MRKDPPETTKVAHLRIEVAELRASLETVESQIAALVSPTSWWEKNGQMDYDAEHLVAAETLRARDLNNAFIEQAPNDDRRLRVLVEEVGEVAEALQAIETAEFLHGGAGAGDPDEVGSRAWYIARHRAQLLAELVQVASVAMRWVATELARGTKP